MDFEISVQYAKDRIQFGRPIGSFQAIQHKAADMVTDVDGSRFIMYRAAWSVDQDEADADMYVHMAKAWTSEATRRVVAHGQQIHGGIGFEGHTVHLPAPEGGRTGVGRCGLPPRAGCRELKL
jgi:alkylation response protein AidB-like acyl-CoA dehydrogenase